MTTVVDDCSRYVFDGGWLARAVIPVIVVPRVTDFLSNRDDTGVTVRKGWNVETSVSVVELESGLDVFVPQAGGAAVGVGSCYGMESSGAVVVTAGTGALAAVDTSELAMESPAVGHRIPVTVVAGASRYGLR